MEPEGGRKPLSLHCGEQLGAGVGWGGRQEMCAVVHPLGSILVSTIQRRIRASQAGLGARTSGLTLPGSWAVPRAEETVSVCLPQSDAACIPRTGGSAGGVPLTLGEAQEPGGYTLRRSLCFTKPS